MTKKQLTYLEKYCPELVSVMNTERLKEFGRQNPSKYPIHTEQGFKELVEDKIRLNSK